MNASKREYVTFSVVCTDLFRRSSVDISLKCSWYSILEGPAIWMVRWTSIAREHVLSRDRRSTSYIPSQMKALPVLV